MTVTDLGVVLDTVRERITKHQRESIGEQDTKAALIVPVLRALGLGRRGPRGRQARVPPSIIGQPCRLRPLPPAKPASVHRGEVARRLARRPQVGEPDPGLRDRGRRRVGCTHRRQRVADLQQPRHRACRTEALSRRADRRSGRPRGADPPTPGEEPDGGSPDRRPLEVGLRRPPGPRGAVRACSVPSPTRPSCVSSAQGLPPSARPRFARAWDVSARHSTSRWLTLPRRQSRQRRPQRPPPDAIGGCACRAEGWRRDAMARGDTRPTRRRRSCAGTARSRTPLQGGRADRPHRGTDRIVFAGQAYDSVSTAGGMARKSIVGSPPGRPYPQTNGWTFWEYRTATARSVSSTTFAGSSTSGRWFRCPREGALAEPRRDDGLFPLAILARSRPLGCARGY